MSAAGLEGATHDAAAVSRFRSLLVARHGRLVAESYFGGADSTTLFDGRAVTKSIVCALAGLAVRDGLLPGGTGSIAPYLAPTDTLDAVDAPATVQQLLTLTPPYPWDYGTGP